MKSKYKHDVQNAVRLHNQGTWHIWTELAEAGVSRQLFGYQRPFLSLIFSLDGPDPNKMTVFQKLIDSKQEQTNPFSPPLKDKVFVLM